MRAGSRYSSNFSFRTKSFLCKCIRMTWWLSKRVSRGVKPSAGILRTPNRVRKLG